MEIRKLEIFFNLNLSTLLNYKLIISLKHFTKIDKYEKINVFHAHDITLSTRGEGWSLWVIHFELAQSQCNAIALRFDITNLPALASLKVLQ
jgi:hypothetical protein